MLDRRRIRELGERESTALNERTPASAATESRMTGTAKEFRVDQRLDAFEGGERVYSRTWELTFPRDGV
jgi:hypothetical protein